MADAPSEKNTLDSSQLASLFHTAAKMMARTYHRHSHAHHAQAHVYSIIKKRGPMTQKELMQMLDVRSSSLSEMLSKLEQRGLIVRERNEKDKRGFIVSVNESCESPFKAIRQKDHQGISDIFAALEDDEKAQLGKLLTKIIQTMEKSSPGCEKRCDKKDGLRNTLKRGGDIKGKLKGKRRIN